MLASCVEAGNGDDSKAVSDVSETSVVSTEESSTEDKKEYIKNIADFIVKADKHGDYYIEKYNGSDAYIEIPSRDSEGHAIMMVYTDTFIGCDFIKGIKIGDGITSVGIDYNFERDKGAGYKDEYTSGTGFCGCTSLEELIIPDSVVYFGTMSGTNITELTIPKNLESIGWGSFAYNKSLKKLVYENPDYDLDVDELAGCYALEELVLPANLTGLDRGAIKTCTGLKTLYLPDGYRGFPMFLPTGCTYYVKKDSVAHKTLVEYNNTDGYTKLTFEVVD